MKMDRLIKLSKSCIGVNEKEAVLRVLDSEFLGMGQEVALFQKELEEFFGRKAICVSSGTAALHLALHACGLKGNEEVLVPSVTYLATYQAISATGATPVSVDVSKSDLLMDMEDCEKKITKKTKVIMPVHYASNPCNMNKLLELKNKYNIRLIEDAAHAFGSYYDNKKIGSFGDVTCFSFDGIKNITSGEGGAVISDDLSILNKVQDASLLGVSNEANYRYKNERKWDFGES